MQEIQPPVRSEQSALQLPAFVCVAGGILAALGSFLPWVKVSADLSQLGGGQFSQNVNGLDGDGAITLIAGIALIAVGVVLMARQGRGALPLGIVGMLGGIVAAGTSIYDIVTIKSTTSGDIAASASKSSGVPVEQARQIIDQFLDFHISVQIGIIIVAIGGVVGLVGGVLALVRRSVAMPAPVVAPSDAPMGIPPVSTPPPPVPGTQVAAPPSGEQAPSAPADEDPPPPV